MRIKTMAFLVVAGLIAIAPQAYAMGGGGGHGGDSSGTFTGHFSDNHGEGTWNDSNGGGGTFSADYTEGDNGSNGSTTHPASEPLSLLAVGVGLLGARYLRRR